ncbi:hypothetical protein [Bacillus sp. SM2101]|uniref:hypothetical protein n=1 Tax=Bacillus sp. SM2101 TaxID=2805366 RepID=UPI001BDE4AB6|nr:hypothetical protein [Bacillus sp. SM2101]
MEKDQNGFEQLTPITASLLREYANQLGIDSRNKSFDEIEDLIVEELAERQLRMNRFKPKLIYRLVGLFK